MLADGQDWLELYNPKEAQCNKGSHKCWVTTGTFWSYCCCHCYSRPWAGREEATYSQKSASSSPAQPPISCNWWKKSSNPVAEHLCLGFWRILRISFAAPRVLQSHGFLTFFKGYRYWTLCIYWAGNTMCALKDAADANQLNCGFSGDASITGLLEPVAAPPDLFQVFVMIYGKLVEW